MNLTNARGFEYGVRHFYSPKSGLLSEVLCEVLSIDHVRSSWLINFGCIYLESKRCTDDLLIQEGQYLRAHTLPRRFPRECRSANLKLIWQNENYLILDKPHGLPCHPTVDNIHENVLAEWNLAHPEQVALLTHRLDVPTGGLLVLAKNLKAQTAFNNSLKEGKIQKTYQAFLTSDPVNLGLWEHWMEPSPKAPKNVVEKCSAESHWQQCLLNISKPAEFYEIQLITGRTHQIRAQCKAMGAPIIGDTAYGADKVYDYERIELKAVRIEFFDALSGINIITTLD